MPVLKTYDLFISHAWRYHDDYYRLESFLNEAPNFQWRNYSVPVHDPLIDSKSFVGQTKLIQMLDSQIKPVNCVLVLAGMYASHSEWIRKEMDIAHRYHKPIVGIVPWGQERTPRVVVEAAQQLVGWQSTSIIEAIRYWSW